MALKVSEIADRGGVSPDAVRFYEREGLLPTPPRSPSGYREYDDSTAHRIHFIKGAQSLGLKLAEIKELLEIQDRGACPCGHTKTLVERHLGEIDAEMKRLSELRGELETMADLECPATGGSPTWACEVQFTKKGGGNMGDATCDCGPECQCDPDTGCC
ncbi:MAG: MerR family DNA-binding protein [Actinobacteria bacterium]|nr:MerR family DNA-binding protein [Actinomycetota bacterium]